MDRVGWAGLLVLEVGNGVGVELFLTGVKINVWKENKVVVLLSRVFDTP